MFPRRKCPQNRYFKEHLSLTALVRCFTTTYIDHWSETTIHKAASRCPLRAPFYHALCLELAGIQRTLLLSRKWPRWPRKPDPASERPESTAIGCHSAPCRRQSESGSRRRSLSPSALCGSRCRTVPSSCSYKTRFRGRRLGCPPPPGQRRWNGTPKHSVYFRRRWGRRRLNSVLRRICYCSAPASRF